MRATLREIIDSYAPDAPLAEASTIPSAWYLDPRILDLERRTVFARSWQPGRSISRGGCWGVLMESKDVSSMAQNAAIN